MKEMKIRTTSPKHSKKVQEALFAEGYYWNTNHPKDCYAPAVERGKWIFTYEDGVLTWDHFEEYGDGHENTEYVLTPLGTFVAAKDYFKQPETPKLNIHERYENPQTVEDKAVKDAFDKSIEKVYEPVGLLPKHIHDKQRMYEILDAMRRYIDADKKIPMMWIAELDELGGEYVEEEF